MSRSKEATLLIQKIESAKERIRNGENNGSMEFRSQRALSIFLGGDTKGANRNKKKLREQGFIFPDTRQKVSFEDRAREGKERIENGDNGGSFEFSSTSSLAIFLNTNHAQVSANREALEKAGFRFPAERQSVPFEERLRDGVERIKNGDNGGSFEFSSMNALLEFLGSGCVGTSERIEKLKKAGFMFPDPKPRKIIPFEDRAEDGINRIKNGENNGSLEFPSLNALVIFLGAQYKMAHKNKEALREKGFRFPEPKPAEMIPFESKMQQGKERIQNGENSGSLEFPSASSLAIFLSTNHTQVTANRETLEGAGFRFPAERQSMPFEERLRDSVERIKNGDNGGSFEFSSMNALVEFVGTNKNTAAANSEAIRKAGLKVLNRDVSTNMRSAIEKCRSRGIKLESGELLLNISREFFSKHIRPLDDKEDYNAVAADIVYNYTTKEKIEAVRVSVLKLISENKADYSILELKLELFVNGIYLGEDSLNEALIFLEENVDREDSIQKRLRLCTSFVKYGFVEIEYVDTLPMLNSSLDGNVMIDKRIGNKNSLMRLWKEYVLYSIKNNITGSVSRASIPSNWDGELDSLFFAIPSYKKAYFLNDETVWFLEEVGYEGILAMCQFGAKQSKDTLPRMYHAIHARCIGFFMYLNKKKYVLLQPKFVIFTGAHSVSYTARTIMGDHVAMNGFEQLLEMSDMPRAEYSKMKQKNVDLLALKFASSVLYDCNLSEISSGDIYAYLKHNSHEAVSGTIILETFVLTLLRNLGNKSAIEKKKEFNFDSEVLRFRHTTKLSSSTLSRYKRLLGELIDVVRREHENGKSNGYIKRYLFQVFALMRFLDTFPKKLSRKEMAAVLNTVITSGVDNSFALWGSENLTASQYEDFTTKMFILFDNIADHEYKGLYSRSWKVGNKTKTKTLIREGMNPEAYKILQHVAIYNPAHAYEYPFPKTTPAGEQLDISWWPYDFSPIPVICNWLIIKTTRRKVNVRQLDVNSFLRFDEDGNLTHMHFNTDKNRSSKESDISINLLRYIFTGEELGLLKKYVDYIRSAYPTMTPVSYESTSEHFEKIMPLFPHHSKNAVIADNWVDGYHAKTMLKTEMILKSEVQKGAFDHFIEEQDRERRKNDLSKIKLVTLKPSAEKKLPENKDMLNEVSLASYASNFSVAGGVHNMRHAGISALGAQLPLVYVRLIAGHADINTTGRVYFHANEDIIAYEIGASLNEPVGSGSRFIQKNIMPFIDSENPEEIEGILSENHFMAASREIEERGERKMIEDGLARCATLHPALWVVKKHGVCGNNEQCPAGTNGCCALCPFNMFSPMHIKGVMYELNTCLEDIALISQKVALDARSGINTSREEMKGAHQQKIVEMVAWSEILDMIGDKIGALGYSETENLPAKKTGKSSKGLYSMGTCSIEESTMELIVDAKRLQINDLNTDNRVSKLSHRLMQAAIHRKDYGALDRMANEGIDYIIDAYGKKTIEGRKEYLKEQLGAGPLFGDTASLDMGSSPAETFLVC